MSQGKILDEFVQITQTNMSRAEVDMFLRRRDYDLEKTLDLYFKENCISENDSKFKSDVPEDMDNTFTGISDQEFKPAKNAF